MGSARDMTEEEKVTSDTLLGEAALRRGLVTPGELRAALAEQARQAGDSRGTPPPLVEILLSQGAINREGADSLISEQTAAPKEKYRVKQELARGGMGAILKAEDARLRRIVAMKTMLDASDESARIRFLEEAQVTGQLEHPNIVPVHELGTDDTGLPFFTMKLVRGRSLENILAGVREHPEKKENLEFTLTRLLGIYVSVCNALAFAHSRGVVHRDLKPANIMIGDYGEVLVMDWGLAKVGAAQSTDGSKERGGEKLGEWVKSLRQDSPGSRTMDGTIMGTPRYMSPEQADGDITGIDARSDIYSLGAILYEILALVPPAEGRTIQELLLNIVEGKVARPEERAPQRYIPPELSAVAMKALATRPADRYQKAEALRRDIELYLDGRAVSAKPDSAWEAFVKLLKRNRAASVTMISASIIVVALVVTGYILNLREREVADEQRGIAERALLSFKEEQAERQREQKEMAPALLAKAKNDLLGREWDAALETARIAVAFDPELLEARRLMASLLAARKDFASAARETEALLRVLPNDLDTRRFLELCREGAKGESTELAASFRDFFTRRDEAVLALVFAKDHKELLSLYRSLLAKAWPDQYVNLQIDAEGCLSLALGAGSVTDLSVLRGMPFRTLVIVGHPVSDLSPLIGCPLEELNLSQTEVSDLGPLQGMPLRRLTVSSRVTDLSPLKGMKLEFFNGYNVAVGDMSPLRGMPLRHLRLSRWPNVGSIDFIRGMPLDSLELRRVPVRDLSPVTGLPITFLSIFDCPTITDLSPLRGLPLRTFKFSPQYIEKGTETIRASSTLEEIYVGQNQKWDPAEFWKRLDDGTWDRGGIPENVVPIRMWRILGPFPISDPPDFQMERLHEFKSVKDHRGAPMTWMRLDERTGVFDLLPIFRASKHSAVYGVAELDVEKATPVTFLGGCDDTLDLVLNGTYLYRNRQLRPYAFGSVNAKGILKAGKNIVIIRCGNEGGGDWKFSLGYVPESP